MAHHVRYMELSTYTERSACMVCGTLFAGLGGAPHRWVFSLGHSSVVSTCSALVWCWCHWAHPHSVSHFVHPAPSPREPWQLDGRAPLCKWPPVTRPRHPAELWCLQIHRLLAPLCKQEPKRRIRKGGEEMIKWRRDYNCILILLCMYVNKSCASFSVWTEESGLGSHLATTDWLDDTHLNWGISVGMCTCISVGFCIKHMVYWS